MRVAMWVRTGCGMLGVAVLSALAVAQPPAPATDGLTFEKGSPSALQIFAGPPARYWINAKGGVDKTKYPGIQITSETAMMEITKLDAKDKDVAGTKTVFKGEADKTMGKWFAGTKKSFKDGKEEDFIGFEAGRYRVKVEVKVKETPTSAERSAYIETVLGFPSMPE